MSSQGNVWRYFDVWLVAAVFILTAYGILMIRSAVTGAPAFEPLPGRQIQWAIIGFIVMIAIAAIDYRVLTSIHWYIYAGIILSLVLVLVAGALGNETRRWIEIPGTSQRIQPSEFGRIFLTITFGQFLASRRDRMHQFSNTIASLVYVGLPIVLIFVQPDLGMSILFVFIWFVMIWLAGLPLTHFGILIAIGIAGIFAVFQFDLLAEYQQERLTTFVNPEAADEEDRFNTEQALISVGSGGWFGKGYLNGTQSQLGFLRVQHTDFIFSVIVEEMGMIFGAAVVLGLMGFILLRIIRVAQLTPDPTGKFICVGIAAILFFQTAVNVGMNIRVLPVTGLTLPFVSYGGSSLTTLFIAIGLVQSVLMRHRKQDFG
jgi:rod shape determining protein RodA